MPIEEYMSFYGNNIVFLVTIYEIFATKINCKTFDLEIDGHSEEVKKGTYAIQLKLFESILVNFSEF